MKSLVVVLFLCLATGIRAQVSLNVCPLYGLNRTIQFGRDDPQQQLKECFPFYQDGSCCKRYEEQAVFGRFQELRFSGGSDRCDLFMNYLMCHICSPDQASWYSAETQQVTICGQFCNRLWDSCGNARLGYRRFRDLYSSGRDFCQSQNFDVQQTNCFNFDFSLIRNDAKLLEVSTKLLFVLSSLVILFVL
ncbi:riboflavin-binding protein-like [Dysidea avara]|uniref:riboflavin-binding protein-like n=1 Tax=Dysidea avara TaxID=196820 RepID=UPI00332BBAA4